MTVANPVNGTRFKIRGVRPPFNAGTGAPTVTQVQNLTGTAAASPYNIVQPGTVTGNLLTVVASNFTGPNLIAGISGGGVATWAQAISAVYNASGVGSVEIWYGIVNAGSASNVVVTRAGGGTNDNHVFNEWHTTGTWTFDKQNSSANQVSGSANAPFVTPTLTPAAAVELAIGAYSGQAQATVQATAPFTALGTYGTSSNNYNEAAYYVTSTTAALSTQWSQASGIVSYTTGLALFRAG